MRARTLLSSFALLASLSAPLAAHAQQQGSESAATAEDLFQRGKSAMAAGKASEACPLFAESYRLDKAGGTLQNLAFCYESLGRPASAYARYQELLSISKASTPPRPDRVQLAEEHIKKLLPQLTRLTFTARSRVPGLVVVVEGTTYQEVSWSSGIILDPGKHEVEASAPGMKPWRTTVSVDERKDGAVEIPTLEAQPVAKSSGGRVVEPHPTRTLGIIVSGTGLAVLVSGGVFGGLMLASNQAAKDKCHQVPGTDPTSFDASGTCYVGSDPYNASHSERTKAETYANVANVLVPVGAVALAAGAYLFFRGPSEKVERGARLVPTLGGASLEGAF